MPLTVSKELNEKIDAVVKLLPEDFKPIEEINKAAGKTLSTDQEYADFAVTLGANPKYGNINVAVLNTLGPVEAKKFFESGYKTLPAQNENLYAAFSDMFKTANDIDVEAGSIDVKIDVEGAAYFRVDYPKREGKPGHGQDPINPKFKAQFDAAIDKLAEDIRTNTPIDPDVKVLIDGDAFASRTASDAYNQALSERRAEFIKEELKKRVGPELAARVEIGTITPHGEKDLPVQTKDGVEDERNRVVTFSGKYHNTKPMAGLDTPARTPEPEKAKEELGCNECIGQDPRIFNKEQGNKFAQAMNDIANGKTPKGYDPAKPYSLTYNPERATAVKRMADDPYQALKMGGNIYNNLENMAASLHAADPKANADKINQIKEAGKNIHETFNYLAGDKRQVNDVHARKHAKGNIDAAEKLLNEYVAGLNLSDEDRKKVTEDFKNVFSDVRKGLDERNKGVIHDRGILTVFDQWSENNKERRQDKADKREARKEADFMSGVLQEYSDKLSAADKAEPKSKATTDKVAEIAKIRENLDKVETFLKNGKGGKEVQANAIAWLDQAQATVADAINASGRSDDDKKKALEKSEQTFAKIKNETGERIYQGQQKTVHRSEVDHLTNVNRHNDPINKWEGKKFNATLEGNNPDKIDRMNNRQDKEIGKKEEDVEKMFKELLKDKEAYVDALKDAKGSKKEKHVNRHNNEAAQALQEFKDGVHNLNLTGVDKKHVAEVTAAIAELEGLGVKGIEKFTAKDGVYPTLNERKPTITPTTGADGKPLITASANTAPDK